MHKKFNFLVCSQNKSESGQNYLGIQSTQELNILFSKPLEGVCMELNAIIDSFYAGEKKEGVGYKEASMWKFHFVWADRR